MGPHNKATDLSAIVRDFIDHSAGWTVDKRPKEVIVYDTSALTSHSSEIKSVTFDFADGSSLSLVGLPAALPHLFGTSLGV